MHQRMGENCIRHLEPIIHRPQRGTISITDSTQEAVFVYISNMIMMNLRLSRTLGKTRRIYIWLNKINGRSMIKIARENILMVFNWLADVELCAQLLLG